MMGAMGSVLLVLAASGLGGDSPGTRREPAVPAPIRLGLPLEGQAAARLAAPVREGSPTLGPASPVAFGSPNSAEDIPFEPNAMPPVRLDLPALDSEPQPPAVQPSQKEKKPALPPLVQPKVEESEEFFAKLVQLTPPAADRLFQMESEETLRGRWRKESQSWPMKIEFPDAKPPAAPPEPGRIRPVLGLLVEPSYVCNRPLYFEQPLAERYGFNLGPIHPFVSTGIFCFDFAVLPIHLVTQPPWSWECHWELETQPGTPYGAGASKWRVTN